MSDGGKDMDIVISPLAVEGNQEGFASSVEFSLDIASGSIKSVFYTFV
jgi:hypothetical protein